jgi:hypothetical protein
VWPLFEKVAKNIEESRILAALHDGLLPKLLSGEIHCKHSEIRKDCTDFKKD